MKKCSKCQQMKDSKEFSKNKARSDGLMSDCKACMKEYKKNYYANNADKVKADVLARKQDLRKKASEYKGSRGCIDCGIKDPRVLDFDHVNGKTYNIFDMIDRGYSWDNILKEIKKCEVRCANCHRIVTAERRK